MRKRRGVIRSSLTKLITKVRDLEDSESPLKRDRAQQALIKLDSLEGDPTLPLPGRRGGTVKSTRSPRPNGGGHSHNETSTVSNN